MFLIKLLRLIRGYVRFEASGGFAERFINLCSLRGIALWSLTACGEKISACTTLEDYLRIHDCAVKSGMRLKHTNTLGLPFFAAKYKHRTGIVCGFVLFFCIIALLSSMIWTIEISSNSKTTDEQILAVLEEAGLKPGTFKSTVNAPEIRFYALSRLPYVSYITVNIIGSSVRVEVTERTERPEITADDTPCDIISTVDGQIATLEVYEGTKLHNVGEAVCRGEVLAGGFIELTNGAVRFRRAEAYAVINTQVSVSAALQKNRTTLYPQKVQKNTTLHIFGIDIPLFFFSVENPQSVRSSCLVAGGTPLPIGFTQEIHTEYGTKEVADSTGKQALSMTESYFEQKLSATADSAQLSEDVTVTPEKISATFLVAVSAGVAQPTMIE